MDARDTARSLLLEVSPITYPAVTKPTKPFDRWYRKIGNPEAWGVFGFDKSGDARGELQVMLPPGYDRALEKALDNSLMKTPDAKLRNRGEPKITYLQPNPSVRPGAKMVAAGIIRVWLAWKRFPANLDLQDWWRRFA